MRDEMKNIRIEAVREVVPSFAKHAKLGHPFSYQRRGKLRVGRAADRVQINDDLGRKLQLGRFEILAQVFE